MSLSYIDGAINLLQNYCKTEKFKGWDPYDGLNSKVFQNSPLKNSSLFRWIWIQLFKRNPVNLRQLFLVEKDFNPKGLALFISSYYNLFQVDPKEEYVKNIKLLADKLIDLVSKGYSGSCWGYNFDWQIRNKYLFPKFTPTVVATAFAVHALEKAYGITNEQVYRDHLISAADFITRDLNRTPHKKGFIFSYSPIKGNDLVYNASLLGSKTLSIIYKFTSNKELLKIARDSIAACVSDQNSDGSWYYGATNYQQWIDSFHTGYNLEAIKIYQDISGDHSFVKNIKKGFEYYINNFFLEDGTPKYYNQNTYPIDIHCPAQLFVTLYHLNKYQQYEELAAKVMDWTIENMQTKKGYFIYQKKRFFSSKIPYMRWSQAFMFYAMSYYLLNEKKKI